ncbi:MAG: Sec-independent protein translocase subunit TatA/TatB [Myxococcota bacterium]
MFGLSFMEIVVLLLLAVVVIGPRQLPSMLRTAGRWITKLRRMAFDMREQSGIDDILRNEGLEQDIRQLRALLRKGNVLDALAIDVDAEIARGARRPRPARAEGTVSAQDDDFDAWDREYPVAGADAYGAPTEDMDPYRVAQEEEPVEDLDEGEDEADETVESVSVSGASKGERADAAGGAAVGAAVGVKSETTDEPRTKSEDEANGGTADRKKA